MDGMNDMNYVRGSQGLRDALAKWNGNDSTFPRGVFGDTINGKSFTDEESEKLERFSHSRRSVAAGWRITRTPRRHRSCTRAGVRTAEQSGILRGACASSRVEYFPFPKGSEVKESTRLRRKRQ